MSEAPEAPIPEQADNEPWRGAKTLKDLLLNGPSWEGVDLDRRPDGGHREIDFSWIDEVIDSTSKDGEPVQASDPLHEIATRVEGDTNLSED